MREVLSGAKLKNNLNFVNILYFYRLTYKLGSNLNAPDSIGKSVGFGGSWNSFFPFKSPSCQTLSQA